MNQDRTSSVLGLANSAGAGQGGAIVHSRGVTRKGEVDFVEFCAKCAENRIQMEMKSRLKFLSQYYLYVV